MVNASDRPAIIRQRREALNLSQSELAQRMGYGKYITVSRHERSERGIATSTWLAYCNVLDLEASTGDFKNKAM